MRSRSDPFADGIYTRDVDENVVDRVLEVAAARGVPPAQVALAWMLSKPGITAPIPDGGSGMVLIEGKPAARVGDLVTEPHALVPLPPPNNIVVGEFTVLIGMGGGGGCGAGGT